MLCAELSGELDHHRARAVMEELDRQIEQNASDFVKLTELTQKREAAQQALDEAEERWLYLTDLAERIEAQKRDKPPGMFFPRKAYTVCVIRFERGKHHETQKQKRSLRRACWRVPAR